VLQDEIGELGHGQAVLPEAPPPPRGSRFLPAFSMETHSARAVFSLLGSPRGWPDVCNLDQAGGFPMTEQGRVEQRRYPRQRVSWPVVLETDDRISFVETIDFSARGAKLCLRKPLALGSVVNLHIHPEDSAEMHVQAVAWRQTRTAWRSSSSVSRSRS
jgi:hypothetical protein